MADSHRTTKSFPRFTPDMRSVSSQEKEMVFDVAQTALDLNYGWLNGRNYTDPNNAWSDADQQVTPDHLMKMMEDLKIRKSTDTEADYKAALNTMRTQIDVIDHQLIEMLGNA